MSPRSNGQQGFTLIELLVSLALFSVISLSIYYSFAGGITVWRKAQEFSSVYQTARLVLEDMAIELKNAVKIAESEFSGAPREMFFTSSRKGNRGTAAGDNTRIARVAYEVRRDPSGQGYALFRRHSTNLKRRGEAELMVGALQSLDFHYTYQNGEGQLQSWSKVWENKEELPLGVKINLKIGGTQFTKLVFLPHGFREKEKL